MTTTGEVVAIRPDGIVTNGIPDSLADALDALEALDLQSTPDAQAAWIAVAGIVTNRADYEAPDIGGPQAVVEYVRRLCAAVDAARDLLREEPPFGAHTRWFENHNPTDAATLNDWEWRYTAAKELLGL